MMLARLAQSSNRVFTPAERKPAGNATNVTCLNRNAGVKPIEEVSQ